MCFSPSPPIPVRSSGCGCLRLRRRRFRREFGLWAWRGRILPGLGARNGPLPTAPPQTRGPGAPPQMGGDTTLVPADAPERHRLAPCAHRCWYFLAPGNRCKVAARCIYRTPPMTSLRPFPAPCRLRPWLHWSLLAATLGALCGSAGAQQTKALTFAHEDMLVPLRLVMESGEIEKATGYKIHWRMFAGGGDVIRAMASGAVQMGETGSSPLTAAASQGQGIQLFWISADIANAEALVARKDSGIARMQDL